MAELIKSISLSQESFVMSYASPPGVQNIENEPISIPESVEVNDAELGLDLLHKSGGFVESNLTLNEMGHEEKTINLPSEDEIKQVYDDAYSEGYNKGLAQASEDFKDGLDTLKELLSDTKDSLLEEAKKTDGLIALIVFEAVKKILGNRLITQDDSLLVVRQTLGDFDVSDIVSIRLSEKDYRTLNESKDFFGMSIDRFPFEVDSNSEIGGAVIELNAGYVDAKLDTQLENFVRSLKEHYSHA